MSERTVKVLVLALVLALAASVSFAGGTTESPTVNLEYWHMWGGDGLKVIQNIVDAFNKANPKIQVIGTSIPAADADQKLLTAIAAGNPPDAFTEWHLTIGTYAEQGALTNMTPLMTGEFNGLKSWFYPSALSLGTYKGNVYALPWTMNSFLLFYNKGFFKDVGLDPESPPKTMDEFFEFQDKMWVIDSNNVVKKMGYYPNGDDLVFYLPMFGLTADNMFHDNRYDLQTPQMLALAEFFSRFAKYPYAESHAFKQDVGQAWDAYMAGKAGFYVSGPWEIDAIRGYNKDMQIGVVPIPPAASGHGNTTAVYGNVNVIPKGAKHPKEAFEFLAWLSGFNNAEWAAKAYLTGGWIGNSPSINSQPAFQDYLKADPLRPIFIDALLSPYDSTMPVSPIGAFFQQQFIAMEDQLLQGKKTPAQAVKELEQSVNQELQKTIKK